MASVLTTLLTAVLTAGVVKILGEGSAFDKYLRYLCALLLTIGLLSPLKSLFEGDFSLSDYIPQADFEQEAVPESFLRSFEYETEKAVAEILFSEFSLDSAACQTVAKAEDENGLPKLTSVSVSLHTLKGAAQTGQIRRYLEGALGCEIIIREEIG